MIECNKYRCMTRDKFTGESGKYLCDLYYPEDGSWDTRGIWLFKGDPIPVHVRGYFPEPMELLNEKTEGKDWTEEAAIKLVAGIIDRAKKDEKSKEYCDSAKVFFNSEWFYELTGKKKDFMKEKKVVDTTKDILKKDHKDFMKRMKKFQKENGHGRTIINR